MWLMRFLIIWFWLSCVLNAADLGSLIIVGGGGVPESVSKYFVKLAGGKAARIGVLPQASSRLNRGDASVAMYSKLGAGEVYIVELDDPKKARVQIGKATGIWFPGGSQAQLYDALNKVGLIGIVLTRHQEGIPFAGTSAGAAIMSLSLIHI